MNNKIINFPLKTHKLNSKNILCLKCKLKQKLQEKWNFSRSNKFEAALLELMELVELLSFVSFWKNVVEFFGMSQRSSLGNFSAKKVLNLARSMSKLCRQKFM